MKIFMQIISIMSSGGKIQLKKLKYIMQFMGIIFLKRYFIRQQFLFVVLFQGFVQLLVVLFLLFYFRNGVSLMLKVRIQRIVMIFFVRVLVIKFLYLFKRILCVIISLQQFVIKVRDCVFVFVLWFLFLIILKVYFQRVL